MDQSSIDRINTLYHKSQSVAKNMWQLLKII